MGVAVQMKVLTTLLMLTVAVSAGPLPDRALTPGAAGSLTAAQLCAKGFSTKSIRDVTEDEKAQVYARYHAKDRAGICACPQGCEVDHLISLEIGGSNDVANLWPQPYCGPWNAHIKDQLENELHRLVCAGRLTLKQAQTEISADWIASWKKRLRP